MSLWVCQKSPCLFLRSWQQLLNIKLARSLGKLLKSDRAQRILIKPEKALNNEGDRKVM
jgi:hypothetical protein